jgi:hypothetical protein
MSLGIKYPASMPTSKPASVPNDNAMENHQIQIAVFGPTRD